MKRLSILIVIAALAAAGCADPLERTSTEELQDQFERGVTGQGRLVPLERSPEDTAAQHSVPETHP